MNLGFSGARISIQEETVVKNMPNACVQSSYCKVLGDTVSPRILREYPTYYEMERLCEDKRITELDIKLLLQERVWRRKPVSTCESWHAALTSWLFSKNEATLLDRFGALYGGDINEQLYDYVLIHGDPTISNTMRNIYGDLRLIDPIQPTGKVPYLKEVDMGKILQSYIGWESLVASGLSFGNPVMENIRECPILVNEPEEMVEKSVFWLAVHLRRIVPYAKAKGRQDVIKEIHKAKNVCL